MKRALVVVAGWLLLISGLFSTVTAADLAAQDTLTLYLLGNGVSWADLGTDPPPARPLPNHDASRNTDPGLSISRGGSGFDEWGWDMYQAWYSTSGGFDLNDYDDNHPAAHHDHIDAPADVDHNDHLRARSHDHDPAPDDNHAATADHHCTARDDDHAGARFGAAGTTASAQRHNSASDSS